MEGDEPPPDRAAVTQKQQARRHECLVAALNAPDPLQASLGATTTELIELARRAKQHVEGPLASGPPFFADPAAVEALNAFLRLTKQAQVFAQLGAQLAAGDRRRRSAPDSRRGTGEEIGT